MYVTPEKPSVALAGLLYESGKNNKTLECECFNRIWIYVINARSDVIILYILFLLTQACFFFWPSSEHGEHFHKTVL